MKAGWQVNKLGDLLDIQNGYAFSSKDYSESGHFVMRIGNVQNSYISLSDPKFIKLPADGSLKRFELSEKDVLVSLTGNVGRVGVIRQEHLPSVLNQRVARIKIRQPSPISEELLLYFLLSDSFRAALTVAGHGAAQQNVSTKDILTIELPIPPLSEQQCIVAILDEAFEGIATAAANAKKNLNNARELFECTLRAVFASKGEGLEVKGLADVCEIASVLVDPRGKEYLDMLHVGGANIESKTGRLFDLKTAREEGLISGKFVFDEAMVLYSKIRPYLMKVARPNFRGLCSADIYPLSVKAEQLDGDFLFYLLLSPEFTEYANAGSARAGMPKVNRDHLFAFRCYFPSLAKQKEYSAKLDELSAETKKLEAIYQQKLTALDELKKAILNQAFSGQLHIKAAA